MNGARLHTRRAGFTFVEVLAALLFLAVVVPGGGHGVDRFQPRVGDGRPRHARGRTGRKQAQRISHRQRLADRRRTPAALRRRSARLPLGNEPSSNWTADPANAVSELRVEVFYPVQGKERSVRLTTLVNPSRQHDRATTATPPRMGRALPECHRRPPACRRCAFTLLEILLASMAAALVLAAFTGCSSTPSICATRATDRVRDARLRARAESVIRTDLQQRADFRRRPRGLAPGRHATTTAAPAARACPVTSSSPPPPAATTAAPTSPATCSRWNIISRPIPTRRRHRRGSTGRQRPRARRHARPARATTAPAAHARSKSCAACSRLPVEFYDGANWQPIVELRQRRPAALTPTAATPPAARVIALGNTTLPDAVRVDVQQAAATPSGHLPPPVEVLVPWTTQPFAGGHARSRPPSTDRHADARRPIAIPNQPRTTAARRRATATAPIRRPSPRRWPRRLRSSACPAGGPPPQWRVLAAARAAMQPQLPYHSRLPDSRRRGSVLIVVLIVCLGLVSLTLVFGHAMLMAYRGADNALAGRQAEAAIAGRGTIRGESCSRPHAQRPRRRSPTRPRTRTPPCRWATRCSGSSAQPAPSDPADSPAFGLVDEASKLNLNSRQPTMLANLPGMTRRSRAGHPRLAAHAGHRLQRRHQQHLDRRRQGRALRDRWTNSNSSTAARTPACSTATTPTSTTSSTRRRARTRQPRPVQPRVARILSRCSAASRTRCADGTQQASTSPTSLPGAAACCSTRRSAPAPRRQIMGNLRRRGTRPAACWNSTPRAD